MCAGLWGIFDFFCLNTPNKLLAMFPNLFLHNVYYYNYILAYPVTAVSQPEQVHRGATPKILGGTHPSFHLLSPPPLSFFPFPFPFPVPACH